jgi:peptidoglycan/LPS O-acetylase OafA/YrhL
MVDQITQGNGIIEDVSSVRPMLDVKTSTALVVTKHIPALDGLRGGAALLVVVTHAINRGFLPGASGGGFLGEVGVSVFFALSGFLMAFLYARQPFSHNTAADYAISRFSRIAPAYLVVIMASYLITIFFDPSFVFQITNANLLRHLLFSGSVGVFWSIPPEVQFYAFFLAIWYAVYAARAGSYLPAIAVALACIGMIAFSKGLPGTLLPVTLTFFLFGSMAGLTSAYVRTRLMWPRAAFASQALLLLFVLIYPEQICLNEFKTTPSVLPYSLLCAALVFTFSVPSRISDAVFGSKPLGLLGKYSFAIYLIHDPCLYVAQKVKSADYVGNWSALALALAVTLGVSGLIHTGIERPAQRHLKRLARFSNVGRKARKNHT